MMQVDLTLLHRLAMVTLRNTDNDKTVVDVPMLLDTGPMFSLIPESSIRQLSLVVDPSEAYELMAFDGRTSAAQVVRLDLILLRRVFRGRFLLIDQDCGILGRDILNHLSLLVDGPRLNWSELP
jgi:hypothetical protein